MKKTNNKSFFSIAVQKSIRSFYCNDNKERTIKMKVAIVAKLNKFLKYVTQQCIDNAFSYALAFVFMWLGKVIL